MVVMMTAMVVRLGIGGRDGTDENEKGYGSKNNVAKLHGDRDPCEPAELGESLRSASAMVAAYAEERLLADNFS